MRTKKSGGESGVVYSTEHGKMCPGCQQPIAACACTRSQSLPVSRDGIVRVGRETSGRKGGGVTVITGVPLDEAGLSRLCSELKRKCGSGGTVKGGVIEIQGEHRDTLVKELAKEGWTVKRVGG
jgi:translation initiation factor 1